MIHDQTADLQQYWDRLRGRRAAPERNDLDPGELRRLLPDLFILDFDADRQPNIRLAGTRLCALFGRELASEPFCDLFRGMERLEMLRIAQQVAAEEAPIAAGVVAHARDGARLPHELVLLPLRHRGMRLQRMLGMLCATTELPIMAPLATSLELVAVRSADAETGRLSARTPSLQTGVAPKEIVLRRGHLSLLRDRRSEKIES